MFTALGALLYLRLVAFSSTYPTTRYTTPQAGRLYVVGTEAPHQPHFPNMSAPPIPYKAFEEHAEKLVLQMREEYRIKNRCSEVYSERMSDLLKGVAKVDWAKRPRTYIVLRMIGRVDAMDSFVEQDLRDIHFPYTQKRLPGSLTDMSDRLRFVDAQSLVLTPAKYIEDIEDGRHVHFRKIPPPYDE